MLQFLDKEQKSLTVIMLIYSDINVIVHPIVSYCNKSYVK